MEIRKSQAQSLGRPIFKLADQKASFVLLKATPEVRKVLGEVLGAAEVDKHVNLRGYVVGIREAKTLEAIAQKLAEGTGEKIRLPLPREARRLLDAPELAGLRSRLVGVGIGSIMTQADPALEVYTGKEGKDKTPVYCRLYGTFNGGSIYSPQPTVVDPAGLGVFLVAEK